MYPQDINKWFFDNLVSNFETVEKESLNIDCCICEKSNKEKVLFKLEVFWTNPKSKYEYRLGTWYVCGGCRFNDKKY